MKNRNIVSIDYSGVYITRVNSRQQEILMADDARFKSTSSEMAFEKVDGRLKLTFHGFFEERPITMTTKHIRADIYVNLKHCKRVVQILQNLFDPKLLDVEKIPKAPDPRAFVEGTTYIPRRDTPATVFPADICEICTPRWFIKSQHVRVYLDVEDDKELKREQIHFGIAGFRSDDLIFSGKNIPIGKIVKATGYLESKVLNAEILYSYLVHYTIP